MAVDIDGGNRRVLLNKEANHGWNVIDYRTDEPETMLMSSGGAVATLNTKTGALHVQMRAKRRHQLRAA